MTEGWHGYSVKKTWWVCFGIDNLGMKEGRHVLSVVEVLSNECKDRILPPVERCFFLVQSWVQREVETMQRYSDKVVDHDVSTVIMHDFFEFF